MKEEDNLDNDFSMDSDVSAEPRRSGFGWIGLLVGFAGIAFGIGAMMMANSASKDLEAFKQELDGRPDGTAEIRGQIESIEERLVSLGAELMRINRSNRQLRDDVQKAIEDLGREVGQNRRQLNDTVSRVQELVTALENRSAPARTTTSTARTSTSTATASTSGSNGSGGDSSAPELPDDGVYRIQAGDTLSAIASRFGVTLTELMNANPGVNPNRLQIGQQIQIPNRN